MKLAPTSIHRADACTWSVGSHKGPDASLIFQRGRRLHSPFNAGNPSSQESRKKASGERGRARGEGLGEIKKLRSRITGSPLTRRLARVIRSVSLIPTDLSRRPIIIPGRGDHNLAGCLFSTTISTTLGSAVVQSPIRIPPVVASSSVPAVSRYQENDSTAVGNPRHAHNLRMDSFATVTRARASGLPYRATIKAQLLAARARGENRRPLKTV